MVAGNTSVILGRPATPPAGAGAQAPSLKVKDGKAALRGALGWTVAASLLGAAVGSVPNVARVSTMAGPSVEADSPSEVPPIWTSLMVTSGKLVSLSGVYCSGEEAASAG